MDNAAVGPVDTAQYGLAAVDRRYGGAQRLPCLVVAMEQPALLDHGLDMRELVEHVGRQLPHLLEHRIVQPDPPVAAEQRDGLSEIVERFALDADQRVESAVEAEALGDVIEQVGDAAIR